MLHFQIPAMFASWLPEPRQFPVLARLGYEPVGHDYEIGLLSDRDRREGFDEVLFDCDRLRGLEGPDYEQKFPEHPGWPCQVTLDGVAVDEGRWARIVGFIALD